MFVSTLLLILIHINLTLQRTTKHSLSCTGFELACSGGALPIELSTQQGLVASVSQLNRTKYFRDDLITLVF